MDSFIFRELLLTNYFFKQLENKQFFFCLLYVCNAGYITLHESLIMAATFTSGEGNKEGTDVCM